MSIWLRVRPEGGGFMFVAVVMDEYTALFQEQAMQSKPVQSER
jgi:hypothetical protein